MDSKALADFCVGYSVMTGGEDQETFLKLARILRDVVPLLLAEHEEVGKKKAEDWERRHEWAADGLPYLIGYKYDAAQAALDALEKEKDNASTNQTS